MQLDEVVVDGVAPQGTETKPGPTNGPTGVQGYEAKNVSSATKTNTPLVEIPQTVSVITRENLNDRNVQSLPEAVAYTPGASSDVFGSDPRFETIYIRGFDTEYNGVYRDGLRELNAAGQGAIFRTEPYGLDAITIIEGPAGATYGYGSPGGIVDLTSKRPVFTQFAETWLQIGDLSGRGKLDKQGDFDVGGPVAGSNGTMAYRVTGVFRDAGAFPSGPNDRIDVAPAFTYQPDLNTTFTFLSGYDKTRVPGTVAFYNGPNFTVTDVMFGDPAFNAIVQEQYRLGYAFEHRFSNNFVVRQNFRYARLDLSNRFTTIDSISDDGTTATRSAGLLYEKQSSVVVDNQAEARFAIGPTKHVVLAGLDYAHADFAVQSGFGAAPDLNLVTRNYGQQGIADPPIIAGALLTADQRQDSLGEYLQDQVEWNNIFLTLSGRHDTVTTGTVSTAAVGDSPGAVAQRDDAFTGRAGLNYRVLPGVFPYISYATTFSPNLGVDAGGQPFQAQRGDQKEVGLKVQVPRTDLQLNAAVFDIRESSVIETNPTTQQSLATGSVTSRGYEFSAIDNIAPGTNFVASFVHLDLRFADNTAGLEGNQLSGIPGTQAKAFVTYRIPVAGPLGGLQLGGGVRHLGFSFADDANTGISKPVTLFDAVAIYDFGALSPTLHGTRAQLNAYNVFDTYSTTCQAGFCYRRAPLQVIGSLIHRW